MILEIVLGGALVLAAIIFAMFVTYLYARRIREGDKGPRSFLQWIRDLIDVAFGL